MSDEICGAWFHDTFGPEGAPLYRCELPKGHAQGHKADRDKTYDLAYWRDNYMTLLEVAKEREAEMKAEIESLRGSVPVLETPPRPHYFVQEADEPVATCRHCGTNDAEETPICAPVEPVSTLNYSKDLTVEPVPDWEDLYGRAAKLANEYETMARNSHDWMVDALAAANRDRDYLLAETLRLTKENNQAAPVPAPRLEEKTIFICRDDGCLHYDHPSPPVGPQE